MLSTRSVRVEGRKEELGGRKEELEGRKEYEGQKEGRRKTGMVGMNELYEERKEELG
jgi:hypothetical protein